MKIVNGKLHADLNVYLDNGAEEYDCPSPDILRITITKTDLIKFISTAQIAKKLGACTVCFWDYRGEFLLYTDNGKTEAAKDWRVEVMQLEITDSGFMNWTGQVKHTDIRWYTEKLNIGDRNIGGKR